MLTAKQKQLLDFIIDYGTEHGHAPRYIEMMEGIGLKAKSGVTRLIHALEERGFIRRPFGRNGGVQVIRTRATMPPTHFVWDWTSQSLKPREEGSTHK
jgi:SOS-response transcriptional repressor LexA